LPISKWKDNDVAPMNSTTKIINRFAGKNVNNEGARQVECMHNEIAENNLPHADLINQ
jgi:hypothetical protein